MELALINDRIVPISDVDSSYLDRGTFFGDGVYEVIRSYNGRIFALEEHLRRFQRSLNEVQITGVDIDDIRSRVLRSFEAATIDNARIYFHITRGSQQRNHLPSPGLKPCFFLTVHKIGDYSADKEHGVRVCTYPDLRWKRCDIKSLNLLPNVLARMAAQQKGCYEAILVNDLGQITEGSGSAFFALADGGKKLITRPLGPQILSSITREHVITVGRDDSFDIAEIAITPQDAQKADELFLAVTTKDIVPVIEFDGVKIGDGRPGPQTRRLIAAFERHVGKHCGGK